MTNYECFIMFEVADGRGVIADAYYRIELPFLPVPGMRINWGFTPDVGGLGTVDHVSWDESTQRLEIWLEDDGGWASVIEYESTEAAESLLQALKERGHIIDRTLRTGAGA